MIRIAAALAVLFTLVYVVTRGSVAPAHAESLNYAGSLSARVTYYNLLGTMADGDYVYPGAAACPKAYLGAQIHVVGPDIWLTCTDTGAAYWFEAGDFKLDVWSPRRPWWLVADYYDIEIYW